MTEQIFYRSLSSELERWSSRVDARIERGTPEELASPQFPTTVLDDIGASPVEVDFDGAKRTVSEIPGRPGVRVTVEVPVASGGWLLACVPSTKPSAKPQATFQSGRGWSEKLDTVIFTWEPEKLDKDEYERWRSEQFELLDRWVHGINVDVENWRQAMADTMEQGIADRRRTLAEIAAFEADTE